MKPDKFDVCSEGEEQETQMATGDTSMKVKQYAANHKLDARVTAKLENSSDGVAEKIIEKPMGHASNPSAHITKAVDGETRKEET